MSALALTAAPMTGLEAAQERPGPAAEFAGGLVGFADDGIVSESLVGGGVRALVGERVNVAIDARIGWELHLRVNGSIGVRLGRSRATS